MAHRIGRTPQIIQPSGNRPEEVRGLARTLFIDSTDIRARLIDMMPKDGSEVMTGPFTLWNTAPPPSPVSPAGSLIFNTDLDVPMFSNGSRWVSDPWVFNVKDFGARGDGIADDTAAIQAAIAAADASGNVFNSNTVFFPPGFYFVTGITSSRPHVFQGAGMHSTTLVLADGSDTHLWTHSLPGDAGGGDPPMFILPRFRDFTINGNNANQTGNFHGFYMPDTAWTILTEYSLGGIFNEITIGDLGGSAIYIGRNRGAGFYSKVFWANCGEGITNYSYDSFFHNASGHSCDIGFHQVEGGSTINLESTYFSNGNAIVIDDAVNAYMMAHALTLDGSQEALVVIDGNSNENMFYSFNGCLLGNVGLAAANTHAAFDLTDAHGVSINNCAFNKAAGTASYLVDVSGGGPVFWNNNYFRTSGDVPYGTDITNDFDKLVLAGDVNVHIRRNSTGDILLRPPAAGQTRAKGTPTNDDATAGDCGEFMQDANFTVAQTSGITSNVAEITLTPGDWDVTGAVYFLPEAATTTTQMAQSISTISGTHDFTIGGFEYVFNDPAGVTGTSLWGGSTIGPRRFSVAANTTIYLTCSTIFSGGDMDAHGTIRARRIR